MFAFILWCSPTATGDKVGECDATWHDNSDYLIWPISFFMQISAIGCWVNLEYDDPYSIETHE